MDTPARIWFAWILLKNMVYMDTLKNMVYMDTPEEYGLYGYSE